jgi:ribonuclease J
LNTSERSACKTISIFNTTIAPPKPLAKNTLRIVPLGGLGEVGRNMSAVEFIDPIRDGGNGKPRILLMDCGVLFPGDDEPGVDLILPDFSYIADRLDQVEALCITHGHEDHIGAIPYLLKLRPDIPVVGTEFTIELIKKKLDWHRIKPNAIYVKEETNVRFGPFEVEFLPVNHSIPDALAVFVRTAAGNILNTGDFKMDQQPLDGRLTDLRAFAKAGALGVDLFMVDSTNAHIPGFVLSESEVGKEIDKIFSSASEGMIIACTFASHVHRVQHIFNAAMRTGRKVALVGRSMVNNMDIAMTLGKLDAHRDILIDLKDVKSLPPERVVVMCTGSQGEELAALSRMARMEHPQVSISPGDTVLFASSLVPGNEKSVTALKNKLIALGANIYSKDNAKVHCSGHACEGELRYIYNIVRPNNVLPIHGENMHLVANALIAQSTGLDAKNVPLILSGGVVDVHNHQASIAGYVENGYVFVDGKNVGGITDDDLEHRRVLSQEGFIAVTVTVDLDAKSVITKPKVVAKGVAEDFSAYYELPGKVRREVEKAMFDTDDVSIDALTRIVRRTTGRWVAKNLRRSPMILPIVSNKQQTMV